MEQIRVDMTPKGIKPVCHSSQYDKGRIIRLNLVDGIQGYTLTGEETLELEVRKPDNNIVTAEVQNTSSNYVLIVTTEQMTACEGDSNCEIRVRLGDTDIGSINFILRVEEDPLKDGIESETEIHNLHTQIEEINAEILPGMVAEEVSRQYDSENVFFDDEPTENHGDGYTVNSAGLKSYIPKAIDELDDVEINNPQANQAIVYNPTTQKFENGEVSTVGGLNDLNDVTLEDVADKQELVYDDTDDVFKNKTTRVELTQAQYDALVNPLPDVDYYITDAPSMQGSAQDLAIQSGSTTNTKAYIDNKFTFSTTERVVGTWIDNRPIYEKTISLGNLPNNSQSQIAHNITDLARIISFEGGAYDGNTGTNIPLPYTGTNFVAVAVITTNIFVTTNSDRSSLVGYLTLRYVKSTD